MKKTPKQQIIATIQNHINSKTEKWGKSEWQDLLNYVEQYEEKESEDINAVLAQFDIHLLDSYYKKHCPNSEWFTYDVITKEQTLLRMISENEELRKDTRIKTLISQWWAHYYLFKKQGVLETFNNVGIIGVMKL